MQFAVEGEDTIEEQPYENTANDGEEFCRAWCYDANTNDCVAYQWVEEELKYEYFKKQKSRTSEYNFRCKYLVTTAKGLLPATRSVPAAEDCHKECKKNKECLQWEWRSNIMTNFEYASV